MLRSRLGSRDSSQSVNIVGWRRSGKSSLLTYVYQRIHEFCAPEKQPLPIMLSLQDQRFHTPTGINEGLRRAIEQATGQAPWQRSENGDLWAINDGLAALRDSGRRLIILIDEFEQISTRLAEFVDWGSDWRYKASDAGYFGLVIASLRPIGEGYASLGLDSPFGNIFLQTELGAFTEPTWHQLVHDGFAQQQLSAAQLALLDELAGGMPYYVQLAASLLWEQPEPTWVREQFALQTAPRFAELLRDLNDLEAHALRYAAGLSGLVAPEPALVQRLHRLGLLRSDGRLFSSALATYLRGTR
ncbi:MAG: hypothetical protein EOM24_20220 [Chloroflexia bacterium]|nr:hypothetical protein [Chloroflexia bacterium]